MSLYFLLSQLTNYNSRPQSCEVCLSFFISCFQYFDLFDCGFPWFSIKTQTVKLQKTFHSHVLNNFWFIIFYLSIWLSPKLSIDNFNRLLFATWFFHSLPSNAMKSAYHTITRHLKRFWFSFSRLCTLFRFHTRMTSYAIRISSIYFSLDYRAKY